MFLDLKWSTWWSCHNAFNLILYLLFPFSVPPGNQLLLCFFVLGALSLVAQYASKTERDVGGRRGCGYSGKRRRRTGVWVRPRARDGIRNVGLFFFMMWDIFSIFF